MVLHADMDGLRPVLVLNLEFSHGPAAASARIEFLDRAGGRVAWLALRGTLDQDSEPALERALEDLGRRAVSQLVVDASELHHLDFRFAARFAGALERFESRVGSVVVCGLSRYLRDILRASGCEPRLHLWPSAEGLLFPVLDRGERVRETAS